MLNKLLLHIKGLKVIRKTFKNWWIHYFPRDGERIFYTRSGDKFYVRCQTRESERSDLSAIVETYLDKQYTKEFDIGKYDVVVDIGAYIGDFTVYAAKKAVNGRVYAFEPHPENFKQLNKNISLNNLKNVYAYEEGISGSKGIQYLYLQNQFSAHTTSPEIAKFKKHLNKGSIAIKVRTIEGVFKDFNLQKINFLKIDCEGGEYEILFNTNKNTFEKIERIAMEVHSHPIYKFKDMIDFLNKVGYKLNYDKIIHEQKLLLISAQK